MTISFLNVFAQRANPLGIGPFIVSKTTLSIIQQLEKELDTLCIIKSSKNYHFFTESKMMEIIPDTLKGEYAGDFRPYFCPQAKILYIKQYNVDGLTLKHIYLTFFNGVLYMFECERTDELIETFKTKHGNPKITSEEKEVECIVYRNEHGVRIKEGKSILKETHNYEEWKKGKIEAQSCIWKHYNIRCEEQHDDWFFIENKTFQAEINGCNSEKWRKLAPR